MVTINISMNGKYMDFGGSIRGEWQRTKYIENQIHILYRLENLGTIDGHTRGYDVVKIKEWTTICFSHDRTMLSNVSNHHGHSDKNSGTTRMRVFFFFESIYQIRHPPFASLGTNRYTQRPGIRIGDMLGTPRFVQIDQILHEMFTQWYPLK